MTDIVERARAAQHSILPQPELIRDLADEVERLRAAAPEAAPTREETIEQCARIASNQARIPDNTPERRAHIYCATTISDAILALKAAPHQRG